MYMIWFDFSLQGEVMAFNSGLSAACFGLHDFCLIHRNFSPGKSKFKGHLEFGSSYNWNIITIWNITEYEALVMQRWVQSWCMKVRGRINFMRLLWKVCRRIGEVAIWKTIILVIVVVKKCSHRRSSGSTTRPWWIIKFSLNLLCKLSTVLYICAYAFKICYTL